MFAKTASTAGILLLTAAVLGWHAQQAQAQGRGGGARPSGGNNFNTFSGSNLGALGAHNYRYQATPYQHQLRVNTPAFAPSNTAGTNPHYGNYGYSGYARPWSPFLPNYDFRSDSVGPSFAGQTAVDAWINPDYAFWNEPPPPRQFVEYPNPYDATGAKASIAESVTGDATAYVTMMVPSGAEVWLNGTKFTATGRVRMYHTGTLAAGKHPYVVKARWQQDSKPVEQSQTVTLSPGASAYLEFPTKAGNAK